MASVVAVVGSTVLAVASPAAASFHPATGVKVGIAPNSAAVGDFNGDGRLDVAVANTGSGTVSLLLGDGFGLWRVGPEDTRVSDEPLSVVAGDFNGDGKTDFATTNGPPSNNVSVRLGNEDARFTAAADVGVGSHPISAVVSDFNGDGKPDLAVANFESDTVSVRLGDGAGNFTAAPDVPVGLHPRSVAVGDFNGDAKADLAVANFGQRHKPTNGHTVSVRLGDGAGGFTAAPDAYASPPVFHFESQAVSVAVGDFNGDGKADLAVADLARDAVTVSRGDGAGNFAKPVEVWGGSTPDPDPLRPPRPADEWSRDDPSFLTAADFNGDGVSDLAVVNTGSDSVSVPLGVRDGPVHGGCRSPEEGCENPDVRVRNAPRAVAVGDFNGDGKPDLATANDDTAPDSRWYPSSALGTVSVHLNQFDGSSGRLLFATAIDQKVGAGPSSIATADFNGDGRLDLIASNTFSNSVSLLLADGIGFWRRGPRDIGVQAGPSAVVTADLNSDGKADFVTTPSHGDTAAVFLGNGDASFTRSPDVVVGGQASNNAAVADFNGDGKPDLAMPHYFSNSVSVRLGDGAGNFTAAPDVAVGYRPKSVAVGDFNGDAKTDLVAANERGLTGGSGGVVSVRLGDGTGSFTAAPDVHVSRPAYRFRSEATSVAVGDFNGDAKADVAVADYGNDAVPVLLGDGAGNFRLVTDVRMQDHYDRPGPDFVAVTDFNADGVSDLAVVNFSNDTVTTPMGMGDGSFHVCSDRLCDTPDVAVRPSPRAVAVGDFNGDGRPDLATANNESFDWGTVSVRINGIPDRTAAETTITATPPNPSPSTSATFSFTGTDLGSGVYFTCRLDGAEYSTACTSPMTYSGLAPGSHTFEVRAQDAAGNADLTPASFTWTIAPRKSADVDGDGRADLCVVNDQAPTGTGRTELHCSSGASNYQSMILDVSTALPLINRAQSSTALADVDGDGRADFCEINEQAPTGTGRTELHCSSGASNYQSMMLDVGTALPLINRAQSSTAMADVDGDGRADFCVVHDQAPTGTGRIEVHCSSGASNFQSMLLNVGAAQPFINRARSWTAFADVDGDGRADFCVVHDQAPTSNDRIEVHCSSGASNFQSMMLDVAAAQPLINRAQAWSVIGSRTTRGFAGTLSIDDVTMPEGNSGTTPATFTVTRSGDTSAPASVEWSTSDGSAVAPEDYTAVATTSLNFAPGETSKTLSVAVVGDTTTEANDGFTVNLANPVGATIADGTGVGRITNDDTVTFSVNDVTVTEGNSGTTTATFTISRSGGGGTGSVKWNTLDAQARAGTDYVAQAPTVVEFAAGETTKTVSVTVTADTVVEPTELFYVRLSAPVRGTIADGSGTGTITNDDTATFSVNDVTVTEGNSATTTATFTITRSGAAGGAASVKWNTLDARAVAGSDYVAQPPTVVNFAPGETTKTVAVTVNGDTVVEATEFFYVRLSAPTGATIADGSATGTITNDD